MMRIKELIQEDDAVSPVIGVILMVAITVILAAVIATFVLGLGEQVSDVSPTNSWDATWNPDDVDTSSISDSDSIIEMTHTSGDSVEADRLTMTGWEKNFGSGEDLDLNLGSLSEVSAGDTVNAFANSPSSGTIVNEDDTVNLIWEGPEDQNAILAQFTAPEDYSAS